MSAQDRRRSAAQASTGAALFGLGSAGSYGLTERLNRKGAAGPYRATYRSARRRSGGLVPAHLPHVGGKLVARGLQGVGLPLAAYGLVNAVRPKPNPTRRLHVREDVLKPVARQAVLHDQVVAGQQALGRRKVAKLLTQGEQRKLNAHRRFGRATALVGGTLGLSALGLRAPSGAKLLARKVPGQVLHHVAALEPKATALSNTLGVGAIGTGAAGSFNYAAQQKLERKKEPMVKRDDRFLRGYKTRISPDAERGYRTLKGGRNRQAAQAGGGGLMTGLGTWLTAHELRARPVAKPAAAIAAAGTLASAIGTESSLHGALSYNRKLGKIKAKARSRRAQGLYGPGRGQSPVDTSSARTRAYNLAKAMGAAR